MRRTKSSSDAIDKHVSGRTVSDRDDVKVEVAKNGRSKSDRRDHCVAAATVISDEFSESDSDVVGSENNNSSCSAVKCDKHQPEKRVVESDSDSAKSKVRKSKSYRRKPVVSDEKSSFKSKVNVKKSSDKRFQGRKSFIYSEFDSESDYKSCAVCKRRALIKPDNFDGVSPTFATFKAHFENAAKFNSWNKDEQLAFLKSSLIGSAAQCLWDQSPDCTDTLQKLWKLLSDRFAGQNLTEKYRTELRSRRRMPGESLDTLCQEIRRLLILGYCQGQFY